MKSRKEPTVTVPRRIIKEIRDSQRYLLKWDGYPHTDEIGNEIKLQDDCFCHCCTAVRILSWTRGLK